MASIPLMIGGALTNALAFSGSIFFLFSQMSGAVERKRHNLAIEQLQRERDTWDEQKLAPIDFIYKKLKEQGHAEKKTFRNVDEAMQTYYYLTGEQLEELPPEPQIFGVFCKKMTIPRLKKKQN